MADGGPGTHIATCHNDTSEGAVHCFRDEHGNWLTYTFSEKGTGTANTGVMPIAAAAATANGKLLSTLLRYDDLLHIYMEFIILLSGCFFRMHRIYLQNSGLVNMLKGCSDGCSACMLSC
jgi:hypothetical protein